MDRGVVFRIMTVTPLNARATGLCLPPLFLFYKEVKGISLLVKLQENRRDC